MTMTMAITITRTLPLDVYLSGECSGGVQALAVAMSMSEKGGAG